MLGARCFAGMFLDGQSRTMVDRPDMQHDTDIGAWERRWSSMRPWYAGTISPTGPFDMLFVHHVDEVAYVHILYELSRKYREKATEKEGFDCQWFCGFDVPYDKFYLLRDAADW